MNHNILSISSSFWNLQLPEDTQLLPLLNFGLRLCTVPYSEETVGAYLACYLTCVLEYLIRCRINVMF